MNKETMKEYLRVVLNEYTYGDLIGEGRLATILGLDLLSANEVVAAYAAFEDWWGLWLRLSNESQNCRMVDDLETRVAALENEMNALAQRRLKER